MYKERKKTTYVKVGEEDIHQHIKKISSMYANMVTRPKVQEEGDKHSP